MFSVFGNFWLFDAKNVCMYTAMSKLMLLKIDLSDMPFLLMIWSQYLKRLVLCYFRQLNKFTPVDTLNLIFHIDLLRLRERG